MATGDQYYYCEKCNHRYNLVGCPIHGQAPAKLFTTVIPSDLEQSLASAQSEPATLRSDLARITAERDRLREANSKMNLALRKIREGQPDMYTMDLIDDVLDAARYDLCAERTSGEDKAHTSEESEEIATLVMRPLGGGKTMRINGLKESEE
ncbi:MAG: hypothetical protein SVT56_01845 [Chloroflexota bacterium]|nr:hypothetical protein [Chloroflexota bacterium]